MDKQEQQNRLRAAQDLLQSGQGAAAGEAFRELLGEDILPGVRALALDGLSASLRVQGRVAEAETHLREALGLLEQMFGPAHPYVAGMLLNLALILRDRNAGDEALALSGRAVSILRGQEPPNAPLLAEALVNLSSHHYDRGDFDAAEANLTEAMALWEGVAGRRSMGVSTCLNNLGRIRENQGRTAEGVALHAEAVNIRQEVLGEHTETAFSLGNYGVALAGDGQWEKACTTLADCVAMYERLGKGTAPHVQQYRQNLEICRRMVAARQARGGASPDVPH